MEGHFSREAFESSNYTWKNPDSKRIKFFVYSTHKYWDKLAAKPDLDKDRVRDPPGSNQMVDVDVFRMKKEFISLYIQEDTDAVYRKNYKIEQFWADLEKIKDDSSLVDYDCFFFMFFTFLSTNESHSEVKQESLHFRDGFIPIHDIWEKVRDIGKFTGKPKVFFIQADDCKLLYEMQEYKGPKGTVFETKRIPVDADRLIIQSTIPKERKGISTSNHDVSDTELEGSFLVEAFIEVMRENRERSTDNIPVDLLSLTTDINRKVKSKTEKKAKDFPYPQISSTFRKFLYL